MLFHTFTDPWKTFQVIDLFFKLSISKCAVLCLLIFSIHTGKLNLTLFLSNVLNRDHSWGCSFVLILDVVKKLWINVAVAEILRTLMLQLQLWLLVFETLFLCKRDLITCTGHCQFG